MVFPSAVHSSEEGGTGCLFQRFDPDALAQIRMFFFQPIAKLIEKFIGLQSSVWAGGFDAVDDFELIICGISSDDIALDDVSALNQREGHPRFVRIHELVINQIDRNRDVWEGVEMCQKLSGNLIFFLCGDQFKGFFIRNCSSPAFLKHVPIYHG